MSMTYEDIVNAAANYIFLDDCADDYDRGELSGAAFVIAQMFNKKKLNVRADIRNAHANRANENQ